MCSKNVFSSISKVIMGDTPKPPKIDIPKTPEVGGTTAQTAADTQPEGAGNLADEQQKKRRRRGTASLVIPLASSAASGGSGLNIPR